MVKEVKANQRRDEKISEDRENASAVKEVRSSFWFAFSRVIQKGIQFFTVPLFTRMLTAEQYGQFSLYNSWMSLISVFATLNLNGVFFINGMTRYEDDQDGYISSMQGLSVVTIGSVFAIYLCAQNKLNEMIGMPRAVICLMFAEMLCSTGINFWMNKQKYGFRYKGLAAVTICIALLNPVLSFIAIQATDEKGFARIFGSAMVNILVGGIFSVINICRGKKLFVKEYWEFALTFTIPLIPHYLSQMVLSQSDRIMIEKMFDTSKVAIYSLAYNIGMVMNLVVDSVNVSFIPWLYKKLKAQKYSRIGQESNRLLLLVACVCIIPILVAPEVVAIMGPEEYAEGVWVIPPVIISCFFTYLYSLFCHIELYFLENKFVTVASVIAAISNIILNFVCMKGWGYIAAGYTTVICYAILAVVHYCFMQKVLKKHGIEEKVFSVRIILIISLLLCVTSAGCMTLYFSPFVRYLLLAFASIELFFNRKRILQAFKLVRTNGN